MKEHNTHSKKKDQDQNMFKLSEPLNTDDTESFENQLKKIHKVKQLVYNFVTENANKIDEILSQESYNLASYLLHESQEQSENLNKSCLNEDNKQISLDQLLKAPSVKILTNKVVKSNITLGKVSWVWNHIKKNKSAGKVKCDVVMLVNGNENRCNRVFGITTSITHLGEHLNAAILTIKEFPYSHSDERLKQFLFKLFDYWDISNRLIRGTTDNNKSIIKGMHLFEKSYIRYTAHTIQLAIKDGLNACDDLLIKSTKLIGGSQYPTLNLPLTEAYVAFYLDPQFKNMSFATNEKKKVLNLISEMLKTINTNINAPSRTEMNWFYNGEVSNSAVDDELERYEKATQMNKYFIEDPLYKIHNPLIW
ncbi:7709_t:CDS:2 [Cetraspora pellucida]|uniref:7709_t:CDS:1 n=1 Tax=Cetraspora pellucida TaxID=1433469 RepID=A0A9N8VK02_9GLOM|nr:7709_t:CDS:2 [Cetraspora pellucida]